MKEELTNRKGSILTPVLAGGALGAGLGLLLAPKSGSEIREDLKRLGNRFSQAIDIGKDLYGESRVFVNKAVEAGKKAYEEEKPLEPSEQRGAFTPGADPGERYHRGRHCAPACAEIGKRDQGGPEAVRIEHTEKGSFRH